MTAPSSGEVSGRGMHELVAELFPIHRSIAGPGVRQTLEILRDHVPLEIREIATGTEVLDWQVPREWKIRDAYIKDLNGDRVVDYRTSNLHVVSHSVAVQGTMSWRDLREHVWTLPDHPTWIPYRTAYFEDRWGFCMSHRQFLELEQAGDRQYEVCIDADLEDGALAYGELFLPGTIEDEVLFSCNVCHPSLANDTLSGVAVTTWLAKHLNGLDRRYSYRFLFIPATIGAITWLARNEPHLHKIKHGLVLTTLGDPGHSTYKRSQKGAEIDRVAEYVLGTTGEPYTLMDFEPIGYDERQFCSPGFDLPMGCLMRSPYGGYPEYHSSADDLSLVQPRYLADSLAKCIQITEILEANRTYVNLKPKGEARLAKTGLYHAFGASPEHANMQGAVLWVLNQSDGGRSLLDIAARSGLAFAEVRSAAEALVHHGLIVDTQSAVRG